MFIIEMTLDIEQLLENSVHINSMSKAITKKQHKKVMHTPMDQFESLNNEILINQRPLSAIVMRAGQTPFYAYDTSVIKNNIRNFRQQMPKSLKLHYAIKANPMPALVNFINPLVDGLDVASGNELNVALNSGMNETNISFAGPAKRRIELEMAIASQVTLNVESFNELDTINQICDQKGLNANVAIRVNPDFELKASGMKMGGGAQQFGIDSELVPEAISRLIQYDLNFAGLHIFTGSQNLNADAIIKNQVNVFDLAKRLVESTNQEISRLNIGGGLGIPYFPGEKNLSLASISEELNENIENFHLSFPSTEICMELGRYLVGNAGVYVSRVVDIKNSRGTKFVILDGGLHQHLSASGNFGQVIRKNYPVAVGNRLNSSELEEVQIVGPLCTPLDLMANKYELPKIEIGDLIVIYQSGAYGFTASPRQFLSHPDAVELLI